MHEKLVRQIEMYRGIDPVDFSCMHENIETHGDELYDALMKSSVSEI